MSKQIKGSIFILLSAFFFGTYGVWSKMMGGIFDDFFQGWTRAIIIVAILSVFGIVFKQMRKIDKEDFKHYLIYAVPGALVVPAYFYGFTHLTIGTATLLFYASLTITNYVLGVLFFKEKMAPIKLMSLILGLMGLYVIFSFSFKELLIPMVISSLSGICGGIEVTFTKRLSDKYSPIQLTTFLYTVSFFICFIFYLFLNNFAIKISLNPVAWIGDIGHAISSLLAFLFVVVGFNLLEPSVAGVIGLVEIPIGIMFGIIIFSEPVTTSIFVGSILIICAVALPNINEYISLKKPRNTVKI